MSTILEIKKELEFNKELLELIEAIKLASAAQFRFLTQKKERFKKFLDSFEGFFQIIQLSGKVYPFLKPTSGVKGIIMVTSDAGFMGGLNQRIITAGIESQEDALSELVVIGEKGAGYLERLKKPFTFFPGIVSQEQYQQAHKLKDYLISQIKEAKLGKLIVIYPKPISFMVQKVTVEPLIPFKLFTPLDPSFKGSRMVPAACGLDPSFKGSRRVYPYGLDGKYPTGLIDKEAPIKEKEKTRVIIESSLSDISQYLAGMWLVYKLYEVFEDAKISEFAARTMHLEKSAQELTEKNERLRSSWFKSIHQAVDRDIRLISSARLLMAKKEKISVNYISSTGHSVG
ncbi:MAG: FoF1 ATP synthase subunit gamma [Candidatus Omnitrophota bacterium]